MLPLGLTLGLTSLEDLALRQSEGMEAALRVAH